MMDSEIASTSNDDCEFDDQFIRRARHMPINKLIEELAYLQQDSHPLLLTVRRGINRDRNVQLDRIRFHRERAELKAKQEFEDKKKENQSEYLARLDELIDESIKRCDELERTNVNDFGVIDINKFPATPVSYESNKKTLRGRGGQLIEPITYFTQNNRIPEFKLNFAYDNARIRNDLDIIWNRPTSRRQIVSVVSIQKPKLTIDNKTFKHGEDVNAWNKIFGNMLAKLEITSENMIILKGAMGWDTRQLTATLEDLEEGRLLITKQKTKDRG